jgi:hypothetical protein
MRALALTLALALAVPAVARAQDATQESKSEDAKLVERFDQLLGEIDAAAKQQDVDALVPRFAELERLLSRYHRVKTDEETKKKRLAAWAERLAPWKELRAAFALQVAITQGNQLLIELKTALDAKRYDETRALHYDLEALARVMKESARPEFAKNADAILEQCHALLEKVPEAG